MQNGKKLVRAIGKIRGGICEEIFVFDDGSIKYFKGDIKILSRKIRASKKRVHINVLKQEGRRIAS